MLFCDTKDALPPTQKYITWKKYDLPIGPMKTSSQGY